ncbi:secretion protein HlyD [Thioalkalivibrio versutus]|uniref:Secretion protein HlyD n=1 Tax=Thioalkalivibrio versutus TaxID=106634 RepID=A0A0G3G4C0_9GAMM|nr:MULTISPECIES: efflux RND transporter periplasmic adaptor subunit [Thioalkalivibrio]AKJ96088.1 secretion protein HlyD [Thioalkalivibrio versutus]OOC47908.1 efflux transporter periplasmic adaptor subunit [Thioalkalivibrio versutus]
MPHVFHVPSLLTTGSLLALLALAPMPLLAEEGFAAQLDWGERHRITAPIAGRIEAIEARAGDRVEADDVLFRLDTRRGDADLRAARATMERLQMELDEAERERDKAEDLYDQTLIAARELELARIDYATVAARLAEARAQRDRIRADLEDATIRAPASGRLVRLDANTGQYVNPALLPPVLAILGTIDPMRAVATVPAATAADLEPGETVTVVVGDQRLSGTIVTIGWEPTGEEPERGYRVEVEFSPMDDTPLRPGQPARIERDS